MNHLKLKYIFLFTICALSFFRTDAQNAVRADSLFAIWSDKSNSDADRVEAFYQRFNPVVNEATNPEAARWAPGLQEAMELAPIVGKEEYMGRFLMLLSGVQIFYTKELDKGCATASEALALSIKLKDYDSAIAAVYNLENCEGHDLITLVENSLSSYSEKISLYRVLVRYYFRHSRLPVALEFAQRAIVLAEANQPLDHQILSEIKIYAGDMHLLIANYDEAERYMLSGLEDAKKSNLNNQIAGSYLELAWMYIRKKDLTEAKTYLDSAMVFMKDKQGCEPCMKRAHSIHAGVKNLKGNYQEALKDLLGIKPHFDKQQISYNFHTANYYSELSNAYLGLHQYNHAIDAASQGIEKMGGNLYSSVLSYENIYKAYTALGNDKMAFEYYQKYIHGRDEITQLRNSQQVTKQELAFQYEQQRLADSLRLEQQKLQQELVFQKEISRQKNSRNILLALGIIAAIIAIGMYFRYRFVEKTKTQLEEKNKIIEAEKKKAEASEKAKHQFLANMSHEIRTPMNAIKGMTDILIRRTPRTEQVEYLDGIRQSTDSLLVIIDDILDISKIEAGKIELESIPFSMKELFSHVHTIMQFKAEEKGLELRAQIPKELPLLSGDPNRLRQVLINLVGNAIKFTTQGVVTMSVQPILLDEEKSELQFTVSDTGVGIDPDRIEKIFKSFEQAYTDTSRKYGGTGLGLSISKKLVELHGGSMWVESEKGKGSQFHFNIVYPLATAEEMSPEEAAIPFEKLARSLQGIRILLVEDNNFNAIVAEEELEDSIPDVQVDVAENGAIAVEKMKSTNYDIILMDVQMPVMNGFEATAKIKAMSPQKTVPPIIAMTANVMKEEVDKCYEAGMDEFIGKPFDTAELLQKMLKLICP